MHMIRIMLFQAGFGLRVSALGPPFVRSRIVAADCSEAGFPSTRVGSTGAKAGTLETHL